MYIYIYIYICIYRERERERDRHVSSSYGTLHSTALRATGRVVCAQRWELLVAADSARPPERKEQLNKYTHSKNNEQ